MSEKGDTILWSTRVLACDGNCNKAWGIDKRPKNQLSRDREDYEYLSDLELGNAPLDPGTYAGGCAKPGLNDKKLNKWCARECERSVMVGQNKIAELDNFVMRVANIRNCAERSNH